ncbi:hypothetical protein [Umboniibacter marinipuniceus]|uniref:Uncharacterized protein n=1 Tax=Umboniibacter marinipuniceus TaxID=569599 RepID=A0A3M0AFU7_9GAMM|nr:hypothetical protein [Umboniibacter marinipuniceus]RMA81365.1 hypothetical protein DFR27_1182 [Umboniibacter marinipuniceus]
MKWIFVVIVACFFCAMSAKADLQDSKSIQITVNLLAIGDEASAMRIELCKRAKYRDYPACEELRVKQSLSTSANSAAATVEDDSTEGVLPQAGTQVLEQDANGQTELALMAAMLTFSDELPSAGASQQATFLSRLFSLEASAASTIAKANDLLVDELDANTWVTISGI